MINCTHLHLYFSLNRKSTVGRGGKRRNWKEEVKGQGIRTPYSVCMYIREDIIQTDTDKP